MGSSQSYLAIKGKSKQDIWQELGLKPCQPSVENSRDISAVFSSKTGWYLMVDRGWSFVEDKDKLAKLSTYAQVLIGAVEEHCNYSMAAGWSNGTNTWMVAHSLDEGAEHLLVTGNPPPPFNEIRDRIREERNNTPEDERHDFYFSVPVDLFKTLTGYCYDGTSDIGDPNELVGDFLIKA